MMHLLGKWRRFLLAFAIVSLAYMAIANEILQRLYLASQQRAPRMPPLIGQLGETIVAFPFAYLRLVNNQFARVGHSLFLLPLLNGLYWGATLAFLTLCIRRPPTR
ncbi:MAG: hypothetical protein KDA42_19490 [Planctomycetales bacterium]|nr:hypothetical protein [Planctomycetales bacterium]